MTGMPSVIDHTTPLRHGYTMADLDALTRRAALGSRWRFIDFDERADTARFAIVEHLLTATQPPGFWELVNAGDRAIRQHVEAVEHGRGYYLTRAGVEPGTPMVRFLRYWRSTAQPTRSPENTVVDVLALHQIWPKLTRGSGPRWSRWPRMTTTRRPPLSWGARITRWCRICSTRARCFCGGGISTSSRRGHGARTCVDSAIQRLRRATARPAATSVAANAAGPTRLRVRRPDPPTSKRPTR